MPRGEFEGSQIHSKTKDCLLPFSHYLLTP